jgi:adenylate kinase
VANQAIEIIGPPGSGKGTQGKILGAVPRFVYFGAGDALRSLPPESDLGRKTRQCLNSGDLVPTDLIMAVWKQHVKKQVNEGVFDPREDILVLDGVPRDLEQAEALASDVEVRAVLHLTCDEETLIRRIQRRSRKEGRNDDARDEVVRRRFEAYYEQTAPLLERYPAEVIVEIAADQTPLGVLAQIVAAVRSCVEQRAGEPISYL